MRRRVRKMKNKLSGNISKTRLQRKADVQLRVHRKTKDLQFRFLFHEGRKVLSVKEETGN